MPASATNLVAIDAANGYSLGLREDGTVIVWGLGNEGQTALPVDLTNVVAISAGFYHGLALRADGTVSAWGGVGTMGGGNIVPPGLSNVVAISAGYQHSVVVLADGTVRAWGLNSFEQATVPPGLGNVTAVAAGQVISLALRGDGTVVGWGQVQAPSGLSNVMAIAAGVYGHNLALLSNGTVVAWGENSHGQGDVPTNVSNVSVIAIGEQHNVVIMRDGTAAAWGLNNWEQSTVPEGLSGLFAAAAGNHHSLVLRGSPLLVEQPASVTVNAGSNHTFRVVAALNPPFAYQWLFDGAPLAGATNSELVLTNIQIGRAGSYAVRVGNGLGVTDSQVATLGVLTNRLDVAINRPGALVYTGGTLGWMATPASHDGIGSAVGGLMSDNSESWLETTLEGPGLVSFWWRVSCEADYDGVELLVDGVTRARLSGDSGWQLGSTPISAGPHVLRWRYSKDSSIAEGEDRAWLDEVVLTVGGEIGLLPFFTEQPNSVAVPVGAPAILQAQAGGSGGLQYQWFMHEIPVDGATNPVLKFASMAPENQATYYVVASNSYGSVQSDVVTLLASYPPTLFGPVPESRTAAAGTIVELIPQVYGDEPMEYQWRQDGIDLPGATNRVLRLEGVRFCDEGSYSFVASNSLGAVVGDAGGLTVVPRGMAVGWGQGRFNPSGFVAGLTNIVQVAATSSRGLVLTANGRAYAADQTEPELFPVFPGVTNLVAIVGGWYHSIGLRKDGVVVGENGMPEPYSGVRAISAGMHHNMALRSNGTVVCWGDNSWGQSTVPSGLAGIKGIAAGMMHSLAVRSNGTVIGWGDNSYGQLNIPPDLNGVASIAANSGHVVALKSNGTMVAWGSVPAEVPPGLSNVVAVAVGSGHSMALRADGSLVTWGINLYGQMEVPSGLGFISGIAACDTVSLVLLPGPIVQRQPCDLIADIGDSISISVTVRGEAPLQYQWRLNETNLSGAIASSLSLSNVTSASAGTYSLKVTDRNGVAETSAPILLTVRNVPQLGTSPSDQSVSIGGQVVFSISATGSASLRYQWLKDGDVLLNATNSTLSVSVSNCSVGGHYSVAVSGGQGSVTSSPALLTVQAPPHIVIQPRSELALVGDSVRLEVEAECGPPPHHQWLFQGSPLAGATNSLLEISQVQLPQAGTYRVVLSNAYGAVTSAPAVLMVWSNRLDEAVDFPGGSWVSSPGTTWFIQTNVTHDGSDAAQSGSAGDGTNMVLETTVVGPGMLSFWWKVSSEFFSDGLRFEAGGQVRAEISGARDWKRVTVPLGSGAQSLRWVYFKDASERGGLDRGWVDEVQFDPGAVINITDQPVNQHVALGEVASFRVVATGATGLSYQWRFKDRDIEGATNGSFKIESIQAEHLGEYTVAVSLPGETVVSGVAHLTARNALFVRSPRSQTVPPGAKLLLTTEVSGDPPFTYQWRFNGTNVPGATNSSFLISPAGFGSSGVYSVAAGNMLGSVESTPANLDVRPRGTVALWANGGYQTNSRAASETNIVALSGGYGFVVGVRSDGTVVGWEGLTNTPPNLRGVTAVAAGNGFAVALRRDGRVEGWGNNSYGALNIPAELTNAIAVAAGMDHVVALKHDGTVVSWGYPFAGATQVPAGLSNVFAVAAGSEFGAALREDGTVVGWGRYIPGELTNVVAFSAGHQHGAAVLRDGSVTGWGNYPWRDESFPPITNAVAASAHAGRTLALLSDRTVQAWGSDFQSLATVPSDLRDVVALSASPFHNSYLRSRDYEPAFLEYPQSQIAFSGDTVTFRAPAQGLTPIRYQWSFNGSPISGATNASLVLSNIVPAQSGNYGVLITNLSGAPNAAAAELLLVDGPPHIDIDPVGGTIFKGSNFTFNVGARSVSPVGYRWLLDGTNLFGAVESALVITNAFPWQSGDYRVVVSNAYGVVTSSVARLTVDSPPLVLSGIPNQLVLIGSNMVFDVEVAGTLPISYQWRRNGLNLSTGNARSLVLNPIQFSDAGEYSILVSNRFGTAISSTGRLDVLPLSPTVLTQPSGRVAPVGTRVELSVTVAGVSPFNFQWLRNDVAITGANDAGLVISDLGVDREGDYRVVVGNGFGSVTSAVASVRVRILPNVVVWGLSNSLVQSVPRDLTNAVKVAAGSDFLVALRADGSVAAWGNNTYGQTNVPAGLNDVVEIAAGDGHAVALRADGRVVGWGWNNFGQATPPITLSNVASIACSGLHTLVVRSNRTITAWGYDDSGQSSLPFGISNVVAVAGSYDQSTALRSDGTPVSMGHRYYGETQTFTNISAISGKSFSFAGLRSNGTIVVWGPGRFSGTNLSGLTNIIALSIGYPVSALQEHGLALSSDGRLAGWGNNSSGQISVPARVTNVMSIAAGLRFSAAVIAPLQFVQYPRGLQAIEGQTVEFEAMAVGRGIVTYQWLRNGLPIPGATNAVLTLPSVLYADQGGYSVRARDGGVTLDSRSASLVVVPRVPEITEHPAHTNALPFEEIIAFRVKATGVGELRYQWRHNGTPIPNETNSTLHRTDVQESDAGAYSVIVMNGHGARRSSNAVLRILVPDVIVDNEFAEVVGVWTTNSGLFQYGTTFRQKARADGSSYVRFTPNLPREGNYNVYEWHPRMSSSGGWVPHIINRGGSPESVTVYQMFGEGQWNFLATRSFPVGRVGFVEIRDSAQFPASLVAADAIRFSYQPSQPRILSQPTNQLGTVGSPITFHVVAQGTPPLRYVWEFNEEPVTGGTNSSLVLSSVNRTRAGQYRVMVISPDGIVISQSALLQVALPRFSAALENGSLRINWPAPFILQSSKAVTGPYKDVPSVASPFVVPITNRQEFFRLRE